MTKRELEGKIRDQDARESQGSRVGGVVSIRLGMSMRRRMDVYSVSYGVATHDEVSSSGSRHSVIQFSRDADDKGFCFQF